MRHPFFSACLIGMFIFVLNGQAHAKTDSSEHTISVTGSCLRNPDADRGAIVITADFRDKDLQAASRHATETYERVKRAVQKLGLKDLEISTSEYSLQEDREWENNKSLFKGYHARMGLKVMTSEIARLGEVIAIAAKENLHDVSDLSMFLSPAKIKAEREACLSDAVKDAHDKADKIAHTAQVRLGKAIQVVEGEMASPPQIPRFNVHMAKMSTLAEAAPAPAVEASHETVSVTVSIAYAID